MALKPTVKVMPHQQKAIDKASANDGNVLLVHSMGMGKTLTSIAIAEKLREEGKAKKVLAVVPASLRSNFVDNGIKKYTDNSVTMFGSVTEHNAYIYDKRIPNTDYYVVSYDMFRKDPHEYIDRTKADTVIIDEIHNFRNMETENYKKMMSARKKVCNVIGLTGTPFNNHPFDVVPALNIVTNEGHDLGTKKEEFQRRFVIKKDDSTHTLKNEAAMKQEFSKWVDYANIDDMNSDDMPDKIVKTVDVEMSPEQVQQYKFVMRRVPPHVRELIANNMPVNRKEAMWILPMITQARGVCNTPSYLDSSLPLSLAAEKSPKIKRVLDDVEQHLKETPDGQVIIHSHLVEGGTNVVSAGLKARGIKHVLFTGQVDHDERNKGIKAYNAGKVKVAVLSSAGVTGLNLPNTTFHAALDGHFNPAVIDQIEARGIRAGGQAHRPPGKRKVLVKRYQSVRPSNFLTGLGRVFKKEATVDQWIYTLANNKSEFNRQAEEIMKTAKAAFARYITNTR